MGLWVKTFLLSFLLLLAAWVAPALAEKRVALVIGNSAYEHAAHLRNPRNDAEAMADALRRLDFDVITGVDLKRSDFVRISAEFNRRSVDADVALFFYAGHGLQVDGQNYLAPVDARLENEVGLKQEMVSFKTILDVMEREQRINLVFLDACRDNPLARNLARGKRTRSIKIGRGLARVELGLASIESGVGMMIAFATQPGNVALDGQGRHSPFTEALVKHIETPGLDIAELMRKVRLDVLNSTQRQQVPWDHSSLTGSFRFKDKPHDDLNLGEEAPAWDERLRKAEEERNNLKAERERLARDRDAFAAQLEKLEAQAEARAKKAQAEKVRAREDKAELARMAKERDEYLERLKMLEGEAERLAALVQANAEERKIASLDPNASPSTTDSAAPTMDAAELALVLQAELKRVGCEPGALDGQWGAKSRAALIRFSTYSKIELNKADPTLQALDAVKSRKTRVCPVQVMAPELPGTPQQKKATTTQTSSTKRRKASAPNTGRCASGPCTSTATFPSGKKVIIQTVPNATANW